MLLIGAAWLLTACERRRNAALRDDEPSPAADAIIERARTPEERHALERIRDETDAEMISRVRALDAEIEALGRENEELRRNLREP